MRGKPYSKPIFMTARLLSAKPVVEKVKLELKSRCEDLKRRGTVPTMSVVLVGDSPASLSYIKNKKKLCEEVGAKFTLHQLPTSISKEKFVKLVEELNMDPQTNGIIIQLPVSEGLKDLELHNMVVPAKDIDGFHNANTQKLYETLPMRGICSEARARRRIRAPEVAMMISRWLVRGAMV